MSEQSYSKQDIEETWDNLNSAKNELEQIESRDAEKKKELVSDRLITATKFKKFTLTNDGRVYVNTALTLMSNFITHSKFNEMLKKEYGVSEAQTIDNAFKNLDGDDDGRNRVDFRCEALADRRVDLDRQRRLAGRREKVGDDELVEGDREGEEAAGL